MADSQIYITNITFSYFGISKTPFGTFTIIIRFEVFLYPQKLLSHRVTFYLVKTVLIVLIPFFVWSEFSSKYFIALVAGV